MQDTAQNYPSNQRLAAGETRWICERAASLGFTLCGVAPAESFPELARYPEWLERGYAGEMRYLSDPRRFAVQHALPNVRSLIVCALNYNSPLPYSTEANAPEADSLNAGASSGPRAWISRYAWGDDYHELLWAKLNALAAELKVRHGAAIEARAYADTGPIHERLGAKYAGLGWVGKNTLLINQSAGSWLFLGVILTSLSRSPSLGPNDSPPADRCGTCRACLDACPTQAIVEPYLMDASRCIAYLTIELRGSIPENLREPMGRHVFGCDICQDVCPWNRKSPRTTAAEFQPRTFSPVSAPAGNAADRREPSLFLADLLWLANLTEDQFRQYFSGSPIKRTKWRGLMRNACIALGNTRLNPASVSFGDALRTLAALSSSSDPVISESARWAIARIQPTGHPAERIQPAAG